MPLTAIITALDEELAPLLRRVDAERRIDVNGHRCTIGTLHGIPVAVMAGGDSIARAEGSLQQLLRSVEVSRVIGIGIAGALSPDLKPGEVVRASRIVDENGVNIAWDEVPVTSVRDAVVLTANAITTSAAAKRAIADRHRDAQAVDTESLGWARAAAAAGVPISIFRVIFDCVTEDLPPIVAGEKGTVDRGAVIRKALLHPTVIPDLLRLRRRINGAADVIATFVVRIVAGVSDELEKYLEETSRTFALCIPLLPYPTRQQVTLAYLLFRIADTFEDAAVWPVAMRTRALADFCALLRDPDPGEARRLAEEWKGGHPTEHAGYLDLLEHVPAVIDAFRATPPEAMEIMRTHVIRSAEGMSGYVSRTSAEGHLQLTGVDDLRHYCYTVAGIVGEMLTELFLIGSPQLASAAQALRERAATFGEALQLVNILKDAASDRKEGRTYIPNDVPVAEVFALARKDLDVATDYTLRMQREGAQRGIVAFCALPVALARATLERVEKFGPGAKVSRPEVYRIVRRLDRSLDANKPALQPGHWS